MIREATAADIPRVLEMGSRSLKQGPYKGLIEDVPAATERLASSVIESGKGKILVAEEDSQLVGLLGYIIFDHYFTGKPTAAEVMWWVEPEFRASMIGIMLFRRMVRELASLRPIRMQFTAPTEEVAKAYESLGMKALEVGYYKDLS